VGVDALRDAARTIDDIVQDAAVTGEVANPSDVGDSGLADALTTFAHKMQGTWRERRAKTDELADGLRKAAKEYERSDREGGDGVRSAAKAF
jgi:hypothetical protein